MGLKKQKETKFGVTANYFRIHTINQITNQKGVQEVEVIMHEFFDKQSRDNGKAPLQHKSIKVLVDLDGMNGNPVKLIYEELKKLPDFENSEDV